MKRFGLILTMLVALLALHAGSALAQTATATATPTATATATVTATPSATPTPNFVNRSGSAFVPVAVGTATPVVILDARRRCAWTANWTEAGDAMCAPILLGNTSPIFTPTSTKGFRLSSSKTPWTDAAIAGDSSMGMSCVSTSGTLNIYTFEEERCLKKGDSP